MKRSEIAAKIRTNFHATGIPIEFTDNVDSGMGSIYHDDAHDEAGGGNKIEISNGASLFLVSLIGSI